MVIAAITIIVCVPVKHDKLLIFFCSNLSTKQILSQTLTILLTNDVPSRLSIFTAIPGIYLKLVPVNELILNAMLRNSLANAKQKQEQGHGGYFALTSLSRFLCRPMATRYIAIFIPILRENRSFRLEDRIIKRRSAERFQPFHMPMAYPKSLDVVFETFRAYPLQSRFARLNDVVLHCGNRCQLVVCSCHIIELYFVA